jgi:hypothetical protein
MLSTGREEVRIVADQTGTPTYAPDLAQAIIGVARNLLASPSDAALRGIFILAEAGKRLPGPGLRSKFSPLSLREASPPRRSSRLARRNIPPPPADRAIPASIAKNFGLSTASTPRTGKYPSPPPSNLNPRKLPHENDPHNRLRRKVVKESPPRGNRRF